MIENFLYTLFFYTFGGALLLSCSILLILKNPIHSVLLLIFAFFNAAGLFLLLGAELLAMILVIVYVGAVAVLFLFVVMMLNTEKERYLPLTNQFKGMGLFLGIILGAELSIVVGGWHFLPQAFSMVNFEILENVSNARGIGRILYTNFGIFFQLSGAILLVAMIGAILLTHRKRKGTLYQDKEAQLYRHKQNTLELRKINSGEGLT